MKFPVTGPGEVVVRLAAAIRTLAQDRALGERLSAGALRRTCACQRSSQRERFAELSRRVLEKNPGRTEASPASLGPPRPSVHRPWTPRKTGKNWGKQAAGITSMLAERLFGARAGGSLGILVYHRVTPPVSALPVSSLNVTPERFRQQIAGLMDRGYVIRPLREVLRNRALGRPPSPRTVVVTFDDGFASVYAYAWPVLRELKAAATIFLTTAYLDSEKPFPFDSWGNTYRSRLPTEVYRPLSSAECREMSADGLVELGSHTHTHRDFSGRPAELGQDTQTSVELLQKHFALKEVGFAFPGGRRYLGQWEENLLAAVKQVPVTCALTTECRPVDWRSDPFGWGRCNVYQWDRVGTITAKLNGFYRWAPKLQERFFGPKDCSSEFGKQPSKGKWAQMKLMRFFPRFRSAYRTLQVAAERETWSRRDMEAFQLDRLNAVWQHAAAYVPYYRELKIKADLPLHFSSLEEFQTTFPVLSKSQVRTRPQHFLSEQPRRGEWKRTGGSTGTPMSVYWASEAHLEMLRCKYRFQSMWGIDLFDRSAFLWGHSASFAPGIAGLVARFRQPLEDRLRNRIRLSAYRLGQQDLHTYLRKLLRFRPVSVYGYSRALYLLALKAAEHGISCDSLKLFILAGEPAFPYLVEKIEQTFGVPAAVEYGSIECGFIAAEWPDRTLRVREDLVFVETLPREDGRYEIVVSVLYNPSFPLLRYALGDVTDAPLHCPDHGFSTLTNVGGRNNDFIVTRSGRFLHSARFDALSKYHSPAIQGFHIQQEAQGALAMMLELNPDSAPADIDTTGLERKLQELVEGYPATVEIVESLPQTLAGKHRIVISHLADTLMGEREYPGLPGRPPSDT